MADLVDGKQEATTSSPPHQEPSRVEKKLTWSKQQPRTEAAAARNARIPTRPKAGKAFARCRRSDEAFAGMEGQVITIDKATNRRLCDYRLASDADHVCRIRHDYLDKTTLSYASIWDQGSYRARRQQLSMAGEHVYFGYLGWEYPTSRLLQRMPLGKYSAMCIIMWG